MERCDPIGDRMRPGRCNPVLLAKLHGRIWDASLALESIESAYDLFVPPRPFLIAKDAVMQNDDAFSALDEVSEVLFSLVVQVASEVVEDEHIVFATNILLKSGFAVTDCSPPEQFTV